MNLLPSLTSTDPVKLSGGFTMILTNACLPGLKWDPDYSYGIEVPWPMRVISRGHAVSWLPCWTQSPGVNGPQVPRGTSPVLPHLCALYMLVPPPGTLFPSNWTRSNSASGTLIREALLIPLNRINYFPCHIKLFIFWPVDTICFQICLSD